MLSIACACSGNALNSWWQLPLQSVPVPAAMVENSSGSGLGVGWCPTSTITDIRRAFGPDHGRTLWELILAWLLPWITWGSTPGPAAWLRIPGKPLGQALEVEDARNSDGYFSLCKSLGLPLVLHNSQNLFCLEKMVYVKIILSILFNSNNLSCYHDC